MEKKPDVEVEQAVASDGPAATQASSETVSDKRALKKNFADLGGWEAFKSGEWLLRLVEKSFRDYYERGTAAHFAEKYPKKKPEFIASKLISVAARNAALLGAGTGLAVSTDEIVAFVTGGEGGVGLPANFAIAVAAIGGEAVGLMGIQLRLVANVARIYEVPLDLDDPEDILTIIAYALGGAAAEAAGKVAMKIGSRVAQKTVQEQVTKEALAAIKSLAKKLGYTIFKKSLVKYTVPVVSVAIGTGWNYASTRTVGKLAKAHFAGLKESRMSE